MKSLKKTEENHTFFGDGRSRAVELKAIFFKCFRLAFDRPKRVKRFSSALFKPFILHVRFLDGCEMIVRCVIG